MSTIRLPPDELFDDNVRCAVRVEPPGLAYGTLTADAAERVRIAERRSTIADGRGQP